MNTAQPGTPDYHIPAAFDLRDHARVREAWQLGDGDVQHAIVAFRPTSCATRAAMSLGAEVDGNARQRRFDVRRRDVFARWLLSFAGDAVPIAPDELVTEYAAIARATRQVYAASASVAQPFEGAMAE